MSLVLLKSTQTGGPFPYYTKDQYNWNTDTKAVQGPTVFNDSASGSYSRPTTDLVDSYLVGAVIRKVYHDGAGGVTFVDGACDLVVTSVATTNESAPGGNGIAQVFTTGTNGPNQYSLDNATWQAASFFNTLVGGSYTVYVKDRFNCTSSMAFSIGAYVPPTPILGCTNPAASNYNPSATEDDGTCVFPEPPVYDVMQPITIEVKHCTPENPVMLVWKNSLGGYDHWIFSYRQRKRNEIVDLGTYELYQDELETTQGTIETLGKQVVAKMTLGADNLTNKQFIAIAGDESDPGMFGSQMIYRIFQDGKRYKVTISNINSAEMDTRSSTHSLEFEILLRRVNTLIG